MKAGTLALIGAGLAAAAAAIVAVTSDRSTPASRQAEAGGHVVEQLPPPSDELLPFEWHEEPAPAPDITLAAADGGQVPLSDFRGRFVLINLWATWCAPCLREMPMLDALASEAAGPGLAVIALNQDRTGLAAAQPFWEKHGFASLELYLDDGLEAGRAIAARGLPTTLLIDRSGNEIARLEGIAAWEDTAVIAYFKRLADTPG